MLSVLGSGGDFEVLCNRLPVQVVHLLQNCLEILDAEYGSGRNYYRKGGYTIYADSSYDMEVITDITSNPCEWRKEIQGYSIELYLLGDDFSVVLCYPKKIKNKEGERNANEQNDSCNGNDILGRWNEKIFT